MEKAHTAYLFEKFQNLKNLHLYLRVQGDCNLRVKLSSSHATISHDGTDSPLKLAIPSDCQIDTDFSTVTQFSDYALLQMKLVEGTHNVIDESDEFPTVDELDCKQASNIVCRFCRESLVQRVRQFPRVLPLPSDHWHEVADLWLCHDGMKLPFAVGKIQAQADTLFVGKTHVLLHRSDVRLDNLVLTEVEHMDEEEIDDVSPDDLLFSVFCARCLSSLGQATSRSGKETVRCRAAPRFLTSSRREDKTDGTDAKHVTDFEFHKCEISSSLPLAPPDPSKVPPLPLSRQEFVDTRNPHEEDALRIAETEVDSYSGAEEDSGDESDDSEKSSSGPESASNSNREAPSPENVDGIPGNADGSPGNADGISENADGSSENGDGSPKELGSTANSITGGESESSSIEKTNSSSQVNAGPAAPHTASESTSCSKSKITNGEPVDMGEEDETLKDCFEIYNVENFLSEKVVTTCTAKRFHRYLVADRDRSKCIVLILVSGESAISFVKSGRKAKPMIPAVKVLYRFTSCDDSRTHEWTMKHEPEFVELSSQQIVDLYAVLERSTESLPNAKDVRTLDEMSVGFLRRLSRYL